MLIGSVHFIPTSSNEWILIRNGKKHFPHSHTPTPTFGKNINENAIRVYNFSKLLNFRCLNFPKTVTYTSSFIVIFVFIYGETEQRMYRFTSCLHGCLMTQTYQNWALSCILHFHKYNRSMSTERLENLELKWLIILPRSIFILWWYAVDGRAEKTATTNGLRNNFYSLHNYSAHFYV